MTIRNLQYLFMPRSIAVFGASDTPGSLGAVLMENVVKGGFSGSIMPVNPRHSVVKGIETYPNVTALPEVPDLAVIATPPGAVPEIVAALGKRGTHAAVVITAGFNTQTADGKRLRQATLEAARPHLLRIIGPNCLGVMAPYVGLNASFAHLNPIQGGIAFIAQSGAIVTSILDWAVAQNVGFSHLVSMGDMLDVDFGDLLDYLATDRQTSAILLYVEAVTQARKFMSAARAASRMKPVIVVKAGRHAEGARAATSHTGALAGADNVYDAAFRRAGMLRVLTLQELFDAVETLAMGYRPNNDRLAIVTNGGGMGVLATDALMHHGGRLAELSSDSSERLNAVLPRTWSRGNPVDIIGDASGGRYRDAMIALADDPNADATLVLNCPTAIASAKEAAQAVATAATRLRKHTVLTSWLGEGTAREARDFFARNRIPSFETPEQAVRAFMQMVHYHRSQELLMETPPSIPEVFEPKVTRARALLDQALADGRSWLSEAEAKEVLAAYAIPIVPTRVARNPDEAARLAEEMDGPVALKILSQDITHKSDVGGVKLDLQNASAVRAAAQSMLDRTRRLRPQARVDGFTVQLTVRRPGAHELILGALEDRQFGPVILFGHGGTAVELINDKAIGLPPLNLRLAREIIAGTRVYRLLQGYRDRPAADLDAIALTLIKIAQLVIDFAEVAELDINPLLADEHGVVALDARIRVGATTRSPLERLAIRPYPKELEAPVRLDGKDLLVRPIRPEDEPALQATVSGLTPEDVRMRFFASIKSLTHATAARFTQLDYDREIALVLTTPDSAGRTEIFGIAQLNADPDVQRAEYAVFVRHDMQRKGVATLLSRRLFDYARSRGIQEIYADILRENRPMLMLAEELHFDRVELPDDRDSVHVLLRV
jgi:acetyltransferase